MGDWIVSFEIEKILRTSPEVSLFLLVWPAPYGSRIKMVMWSFSALAIAYTIVQGTKWLLKIRKIKKFISNFVQYDLFKYMDEENNNGIKQK